MVVLNLFIGVIINSMSEMHSEVIARKRGKLQQGERFDLIDELEHIVKDIDSLKDSVRAVRLQLKRTNAAN
jgi:hypothetical protein